jgi:tRNA A37 threonylcarbamoyltransferase TsaD
MRTADISLARKETKTALYAQRKRFMMKAGIILTGEVAWSPMLLDLQRLYHKLTQNRATAQKCADKLQKHGVITLMGKMSQLLSATTQPKDVMHTGLIAISNCLRSMDRKMEVI